MCPNHSTGQLDRFRCSGDLVNKQIKVNIDKTSDVGWWVEKSGDPILVHDVLCCWANTRTSSRRTPLFLDWPRYDRTVGRAGLSLYDALGTDRVGAPC